MAAGTPLNIVRLDGVHCAAPTLTIPHEYTEYAQTSTEEVQARIRDAHVVITTRVPMTAADVERAPALRLVVVMAIGTDCVDVRACRDRGVQVCNVPAASNEAVAEHALALLMAVRRRVVQLHGLVLDGLLWPAEASCVSRFNGVPMGLTEEVIGIVGVGELGNRVANIVKALGMRVLMAERKGVEEPNVREGRTSFSETLKTSTALILTCPLTPATQSMIGEDEFGFMRPDSVFINVARGGIVVEESLIKALKDRRIAGAATDVFIEEPATRENSVLIREGRDIPDLVMSPHVAWYAHSSIEKLRRIVQLNIEGFWKGEPQNLVE